MQLRWSPNFPALFSWNSEPSRITAAKMAECKWLKPQLVAHFEFVEWTEDAHLRHSRFVALREDTKAKDVRRA
jgi:ATP-dependent DNA ligase